MRVRAAMSAVEVMVAVVVTAAVAIPLITLMMHEREAEQRSRFEYMALLAARDEAYQARVLVALGKRPNDVDHEWKALEGKALGALTDVFESAPGGPDYHKDQKRVATRLKVDTSGSTGRVVTATVSARWMDPAALTQAGGAQEKRTVLEFVTGLMKPPGGP